MPPTRSYMRRVRGRILSARMRSSLIFHGEINYYLGKEEIGDGDFWIRDNEYILVHLDPDVRKNLKTNSHFEKAS